MPKSIPDDMMDDAYVQSRIPDQPAQDRPGQVQDATPYPADFILAVAQKDADVARAPGLVFTLEDLERINAYVADGLALPTATPTVTQYVGYQTAGIAGLEPTEIATLFGQIHANAQKWSAIDQQLCKVSADLEDVARRIVTTGDNLITAINELPAAKRASSQVGNTKLADLPHNRVPKITYGNEDREQTPRLRNLLTNMRNDIEREKQGTDALKTSIGGFRTEIATQLEPTVHRKIQLINQSNLAATVQDLQNKISEKDTEIENKRKEYKEDVIKANSGAIGGPLIWAITGGIFGKKAENARKAKNRLIGERTNLQNQLTTDQQLLKSLHTLQGHFADLDTRLLDAEQALLHLSTVWQTASASLDASIQEFDKITDTTSLRHFVGTFKRALGAWRTVETEMIALNQIFHVYQATVNFGTSNLRAANCTVTTGDGALYNAYYGHSWILHLRGTSYFEIRFTRPNANNHQAHLRMNHLSSYNANQPGESPINIVVNGRIYQQSYSPPSSNWVYDTFDISSFIHNGENVLRLELQPAGITNYWINWLGILLS